MTPEHFDLSLRGMHRRTPFTSFTVELVSGEKITVDHPEAMVIRAGMAVFIDARGMPTLFDHESVSRVIGEGQRNAS